MSDSSITGQLDPQPANSPPRYRVFGGQSFRSPDVKAKSQLRIIWDGLKRDSFAMAGLVIILATIFLALFAHSSRRTTRWRRIRPFAFLQSAPPGTCWAPMGTAEIS